MQPLRAYGLTHRSSGLATSALRADFAHRLAWRSTASVKGGSSGLKITRWCLGQCYRKVIGALPNIKSGLVVVDDRKLLSLMIIWLNGAFGVGKTQTAFELYSRIPGSFVFDPEQIGFSLRKILPPGIRAGDFQDHQIWREFTYQGLRYVAENFAGTIIVPMTVVNPLYYDQTVGALRREGLQVHHFTLLASRDTILRRLRRRGDRSNAWNARQLDRCLKSLPDEKFAVHLNTENKAIEAVAEEIAHYVDVDLKPSTWHPILRPLKRMVVQVCHVRL